MIDLFYPPKVRIPPADRVHRIAHLEETSRPKRSDYNREFHKASRPERLAKMKSWYYAHREQEIARVSKWQQENRERSREIKREYARRKRAKLRASKLVANKYETAIPTLCDSLTT